MATKPKEGAAPVVQVSVQMLWPDEDENETTAQASPIREGFRGVCQKLDRPRPPERSGLPDAGLAEGLRVTIKELAEALGMDRSSCRRYVLRLGYKPKQMRTADSGFQTAGTLSSAECRAVWASRRSDGYVQGDAPFSR